MLAALILVPLMNFTYSSHRSALIRTQRTLELYASDAGIEDALYQIKTEKKGTALANLGFGNTSSYNPGTPAMNDRTENVTVQKVWLPGDLAGTNAFGNLWKTDAPVNNDTNPSLDTDKSDKLVVVGMLQTVQATAAADDFDHGWPGGSSDGNWTGNWTTTGSASLASGGKSGYCLNFAGSNGTAMRQTILPRYIKPELQLWVKGSSFGSSDTVACKVSTVTNPTVESDWTTVMTWGIGNVTGIWTTGNYTINLYDQYGIGDYSVATPLWVRLDANLSAQTVAQDDFNSGGWSGGSGWYNNNAWTTSGSSSATVVNDGTNAHSPNNDVKLNGSGYVMRRVSIPSSVTNPQITLWAKTSRFGSSDKVYLKVSTKTSPNPATSTDWSSPNGRTITTWNSSSSSSYTSYTYDLSTYAGQNIWILFSGSMTSPATTLAQDNFEGTGSVWCRNPSGWADSCWSPSGEAAVVTTGTPNGGSYHLRLRSNTGVARRAVSISNYNAPRLQFYAKTNNSFSSSDRAYCYVGTSATGPWYLVQTWSARQTSYTSYDIPFPSQVSGASTVWVRFASGMSDTSKEFYVDDLKVVDTSCFYFDDVSIAGVSPSTSVDNLWIGYQSNSNDIEIAYTNEDFDGSYNSGTGNDPANLDRIGVWMPPGCEYIGVVGNQTTAKLSQYLSQKPDILPAKYGDGTILEWDFSSTVNLATAPVGNSTSMPIVWDLTFSYSVPPTQVVEGMFVWIEAHGGGGLTCLSWDHGYEIYKAVSKAHSQILGTNTQVAAYVGQGAIDKNGAASYGDYVATGNPLLIDYTEDSYDIKEKVIDPAVSSTWTWNLSSGRDGNHAYYYDGRSEITSIPSDAKVTAAWLYWSAFVKTNQWSGPDKNVTFMYPKRYGSESFAVVAGNTSSRTYVVNSYSSSSEPMDLLAHQPVLTLSDMRYKGEVLGTATLGNSTPDSWLTLHKPILASPAPSVKVGGNLTSQSGNYTIDYATGNVTIINPNLSGQVTIDYNVSGTMTLGNGTDYTINQVAEGIGYKYTGFTITNSQITGDHLQGTVTIDYYYGKHWEDVTHAAYDKYGTSLDPVQVLVPPTSPTGDSYACFTDVTGLLTGNSTYTNFTGDGQYAVRNVQATQGVDGDTSFGIRCYSGWSLIVLYESPSETAHQFYLYDPIHNGVSACPFHMDQYTTKDFTLDNFYPPEGVVKGRTTYFVGEGDEGGSYTGESIGFKGVSQTTYTDLNDPPINPAGDIMNCRSTTGERGVDIDTYNILNEVGNDTSANVELHTEADRWYLVYMILSFKTNVVPPPDYSFNVASITYQYQLGGK